jgi:hypothetical protein
MEVRDSSFDYACPLQCAELVHRLTAYAINDKLFREIGISQAKGPSRADSR